MTLAINLNKPVLRLALMVLALVLAGGLLRLVYVRFVVSVLTAKNTPVSVEALTTMAASLPQSARLQARLADALLSQGAPDSQLLAQADAAATQAVNLAPLNANHHILFAAAKSMVGEAEVSELHLRTAMTLAPHNAQIRLAIA